MLLTTHQQQYFDETLPLRFTSQFRIATSFENCADSRAAKTIDSRRLGPGLGTAVRSFKQAFSETPAFSRT